MPVSCCSDCYFTSAGVNTLEKKINFGRWFRHTRGQFIQAFWVGKRDGIVLDIGVGICPPIESDRITLEITPRDQNAYLMASITLIR